MIRSQSQNVTIIDRAIYLWTLCTIDWMLERQEPISINNLNRIFGEYETKRFNFYREIAIEWKDLDPNGIKLTPKGQRIVNSWLRHSYNIYGIEWS